MENYYELSEMLLDSYGVEEMISRVCGMESNFSMDFEL